MNKEFSTFIRGFWELPKEQPNLWHSFLRGAIVAGFLSLVFPVASAMGLVLWMVFAGSTWAAVDYISWKHYAKKRGA